ncbi:nucleotide exchange factor GrpE [Desulfovibrio sp. TomC]|uniref:nucleotide exchange factor GrpE n=1 Tax=Desulfovibrio sp. TomC TaxID=1562888 RepID=UPI0009E1E3E6|nr:nucleotide exchange factor GrpE [Desulfovibrio sp. TomC]
MGDNNEGTDEIANETLGNGFESSPVTDILSSGKDRIKRILMLTESNLEFATFLKQKFIERFEYDETKEKAFDKLYDELQSQKNLNNFIDRSMKPLLLDLLLFHDSLASLIRSIESSSNDGDDLLNHVKSLLDEFLEILYRQEVVTIEDEDDINPKNHRTIRVIPTKNLNEDFQIVDVLRKGFIWRNNVLRPQDVTIKRFEKTHTPQSNNT